jgi:hypothetical protein
MRLFSVPVIAYIAGAGMLLGCSSSPGTTTGTGGSSSTATSSGSTGGSATGGTGAGGSMPVDECVSGTAHCDVNATCTDLPDGFKCTCIAGYAGDGTTCADIDECTTKTSTCDPIAICTNTVGSFTCACKPGDNGDGKKCSTSDSCPSPIALDPAKLPLSVTGDTTGGAPNASYGSSACPGARNSAGSASNDVVYSFTPTASHSYTFTLSSASFDSALYIVSDCTKIDTTCLGASNSACSVNCTESLTAPLTAGTTYFIVVDGSSNLTNEAGPYTLVIAAGASQVDVSSVLTDDTVVNNGAGAMDLQQVTMDNNANALATQSAATALGGAGASGLPDNGFFPADANHPDVQLHWDNASNGPNSRVVPPGGPAFSFPMAPAAYTQLQVYMLSTEGTSSVVFTLTYSDASTELRDIQLNDWFDDPSPPSQFFLIDGLDRASILGDAIDAAHDPAISGINLNPNPSKTLTSVKAALTPGGGWLVFYGATAW